jgi:hypothetical protein
MERVAFVPSVLKPPAGAAVLGRASGGWWVACDDEALLVGAGKIELLWLSRAAYERAVRRLDQDEVARVIALRRTAFSSRIPSRAKAELFTLRLRALAVAARDQASDAFERSLVVLASLAGASRFKGVGDVGLLERLLEREQGLRNELDSPEGHPEAAPGEIDARRKLADDTTQLLRKVGRPEYAQAPLYVALVRGYWLTPPPAELLADWKRDGIPAVPWRGGVIGPLRPDEMAELQPSPAEVKLMFPDANQAAGLRLSLTPAQLTVELEDRDRALNMTPHVAGLRVELATFRRNAAGLVQDAGIATALARQIASEAPIVMAALAARPAFVEVAGPPALADTEAEFTAAAKLLSALAAFRGIDWQPLAAELLAIAKGP